jgi:hypothetical protein
VVTRRVWMRITRWILLPVVTLLGVTSVARAECDKDTDCPGDEICEEGRCADVGSGTCGGDEDCLGGQICVSGTCIELRPEGEGILRADDPRLDWVQRRHRGSQLMAAAGAFPLWMGQGFTVASMITTSDPDDRQLARGFAVAGLASAGVGAIVVSGAAGLARSTTTELGIPPRPRTLWILAWIFEGVSLGLAATGMVVLLSDAELDSGSVAQGVAFRTLSFSSLTGIAGSIMLGIEVGLARKHLRNHVYTLSQRAAKPGSRVDIAPFIAPTPRAVTAGIVGRW